MDQIISFLSSILGFIMDFFFQGLTLIGYPRLWACIVLYTVVTRIFFLPERISSYRNRLLAPVVNLDLLEVDPDYFTKTKDKTLATKRALLKKEVEKKYKIVNRSGCLMSIIQYPFLVALFYVVRNPQEFVPSLEVLSSVSSEVNNFLGVSLAAIPSDCIGVAGLEMLAYVPPFIILVNFLKMFGSLKKAKTVSQKIKVYTLCGVLTLLMGALSATLPLAISLYWVTNDIVNYVFDFFIRKFTLKKPSIIAIMNDYDVRLLKMKEKRAAEDAAKAQQSISAASVSAE